VDGVTLGAHALWLAPRDLARIGQLVLDDGVWDGQRVVSADWIRESTSLHIDGPATMHGYPYGFYWWLAPELDAVTAWGHGGQFVFVLPAERLVLVLTALPNTNDHKLGNGLTELLSLVRTLLGS
jgi:CubicO group peptidase (beta-lactamase class C family)